MKEAGEAGEAEGEELITNAQYNSWRGCALSVAMPQALRLCSLQVPNT
ncbi:MULTISPECIES: hypothetical protein [unclassified Nostoc]|nr:hypothetical protein [Nostoc sp. ChiQUE02]MDZ8228553.1 hypothetical protein [Nostoc sp. ChiQUE02]